MKIAKYRALLVVATVLTFGAFGSYALAATNSSAAKTTKPSTGDANSIRISPLRSDLTIEPGKTGTVKVNVTNLSKQTAVYQTIENDFVAGDEKGTPAIVLSPNSYAPTHSLKRFMVPLGNITVPAGTTQAITLTIKVPITAQAGGYFGALRFAPASNGNGNLSLTSSAASLVLLTVPGPAVQKLTLTNFDVQQGSFTATNFRTPKNLSVLVRFENAGNLQETPFGQINVTKNKNKLLYTYNFNQTDPKDEILPDSARRWSVPLKGVGVFGKYTVTGTFTYGSGQSIQVSKTFWIVPTKYIIAGIVALIVVILFVFFIWRSIQRTRYRNHYRGRR